MRASTCDIARPLKGERRRHGLRRERLVSPEAWGGPGALLATAVMLLGAGLVLMLPKAFGVDSWLELVAGRLIWTSGIPHRETFTVLAVGRPWIDQQWLAQLTSYSLYRLGGLGLLGVANVTLIVSGVAIAMRTARGLGASLLSALGLALLCSWLLLPATEVRTQAFAFPLFALIVQILSADSRRSSRRVYLTLPILLLWANVHGTVTLGAALVLLRGLTIAWEQRAQIAERPIRAIRPVALVAGAPLTLFATPYGLHVLSYYRATLDNSALRHLVTEWQPVTASIVVAVPFALLAGIALWSFRARDRATLWEKLALIALAAASVDVIRNVPFFALTALAIVPAAMTKRAVDTPTLDALRRRLNAGTVLASAALAVTAATFTVVRPASALEGSYSDRALLATVEEAMRADRHLLVVADSRFSDLILWHAPWLAGRVANDVRYELYTSAEDTGVQSLLTATGGEWAGTARDFPLVVLARPADNRGIASLLRDRQSRLLYADPQSIVILRSAVGSDSAPPIRPSHVPGA